MARVSVRGLRFRVRVESGEVDVDDGIFREREFIYQ